MNARHLSTDTPTPTARSARITLRQLCSMGVPGLRLLPSLLPALRQCVPASHAAFFFCDERGGIVNLYAERMLSPVGMAHYHDRHSEQAFRGPYLARVRASRPTSRRTADANEQASGYARDVLRPLDMHHFLYAIVRHQGRVLGQLSLYRGEADEPFSLQDEDMLAGLLHYLGPALAVPIPDTGTATHHQAAEEGVAVLDAQGQLLFADAQWPRLVRMAHGNSIAPASAMAEAQTLPRFIGALLEALASAPQAQHQVNSHWGQFVFRRLEVQGPTGAKATLLRVLRLALAPLQLAQGAAALGLSPQQREVALAMAQGLSNAEIAQQLQISGNTASYHAKQIFARLGVHERSAVARVLADAAAGLSGTAQAPMSVLPPAPPGGDRRTSYLSE